MVHPRTPCPARSHPIYFPMPPPFLETPRLILRAHQMTDAPALARLCNDIDVVRWTSSQPFPYELRHAEEFIANREPEYQARKATVFAAFLKHTDPKGLPAEGPLIGGVGLHNHVQDQERAELGYLIGKDHWNHGYATELAAAMVRFGFEQQQLTRIHAGVFNGNNASARVLEKLGFQREGIQRRHINRLGTWRDLILFGLLKDEWNA